jgi:arsenate reductase-like glutaredoxin family protein
MNFNLKNIIYSLFNNATQLFDNTQILQRFNEMLADDLDNNELNKLKNLLDTRTNSELVESYQLSNMEQFLGIPFITYNETKRRSIIRYYFNILKNKGNILSYDLMLKCLGHGGTKINNVKESFSYELELTNKKPLSQEELNEIIRAVQFIEPLYCGVYSIKADRVYDIFIIFVQNNGDLMYETIVDLNFILDKNGDLLLVNNTFFRYFIEKNGDFIKN